MLCFYVVPVLFLSTELLQEKKVNKIHKQKKNEKRNKKTKPFSCNSTELLEFATLSPDCGRSTLSRL